MGGDALALAYCPAGHTLHATAPAGDTDPDAHGRQSVPRAFEYVPPGHWEHDPAPACAAALLVVPGEQGVHAVAPTVAITTAFA